MNGKIFSAVAKQGMPGNLTANCSRFPRAPVDQEPQKPAGFTAKRLQNSAQGGGLAEPWVLNVKRGPL
jgi:hypothetical protein